MTEPSFGFEITRMGSVLYCVFLAYADQDLLAMAWQETPLSRPRARFRIRTYHPDSQNPWDGMDDKSWHELTFPDAGDALVRQLQQWIAQIRETWHEPTALVDELLGPVSPQALVTWLQSRAWVHGKSLRPGDPDDEAWLAERRAARRQRRRGR